MAAAKSLPHPGGDGFDGTHGGNTLDRPPSLVPGEQRRGLLAVSPESGRHGGGIVVRPLLHAPAPVEPSQDFLVGHVEEQHGVHPAPLLRQDPLHPLGLRDGAYHAVEDHALGGLGLGQLIADDPQDDIVAHQITSFHHRLGLESERRASLDGVPQQVAGGELGQTERLGQERALGALAGAGGSHQKDVHERMGWEGEGR